MANFDWINKGNKDLSLLKPKNLLQNEKFYINEIMSKKIFRNYIENFTIHALNFSEIRIKWRIVNTGIYYLKSIVFWEI